MRRRAAIPPKGGAAMIAVLCALALFMLMGLALLLSASALTATASQRLQREGCYQLAKSFSLAIKAQLAEVTVTKADIPGAGGMESASLPAQMLDITNRLEPKDEAGDATVFAQSGQAPLPEGQYGKLTLRVRTEDYSGDTAGGEDVSFDYTVYITVVAAQGAAERSYTGVYVRRKEAVYTLGGQVVEKKDDGWYFTEGPDSGTKLTEDQVSKKALDADKTKYTFIYQYGE